MHADILVGNEILRGIYGGQKKRVTTGMVFFVSLLWDPFMVLIPSLFVSSCLIVLTLCSKF